jgi:hypothetical protein
MAPEAKSGPEIIYCEKLFCSLSREACIKRQYMAHEYQYGRTWNKYEQCHDCEQGIKINGGRTMTKAALTCRIDGCSAPVLARWMCQRHYDQWRARGKKIEELPEGLGERKQPIRDKALAKVTKPKIKAAPKNGKALVAGKNAPASITQFVDGLMATVRREVIADMRRELNAAFDRMGKA